MVEKLEAPESQSHHSRGGWLTLFLWVFFLLFVVYPLCIGPAAWLHLKVPSLRPAIEGFYAPITMLANQSERLAGYLRWYVLDVWRIPVVK